MKKTLTTLIALTFLAACGEGDNNHHNNEHAHENNEHQHESIEADACEHMADGPAETVAAAGVGGTPATLSATHTRYDTPVPAATPVLFDVEISEAAEMHFFFSQNVDVTLSTATGDVLTADEEIPTVDDCADVAEGLAFDLGVGTYSLQVTAPAADLSIVLVPGTEEGHE